MEELKELYKKFSPDSKLEENQGGKLINLRHVKEQTLEICLAAVNQDGYALEFVKEQTPEICLVAVNQDGYTLQFVKEQTPEICLAAVKQNLEAFKYVNQKYLK